jgi:hypothetical protein
MASFIKRIFNSLQLEVDGKHLTESCDVADRFSKHFYSRYNNPCPVVFSTLSSSSEFVSLAPVSDSDFLKLLSP